MYIVHVQRKTRVTVFIYPYFIMSIGEEPMKSGTQMQLYIRRWRPSQYVLDPYQEVVLDTANPEELKRKVQYAININNNVLPCMYV